VALQPPWASALPCQASVSAATCQSWCQVLPVAASPGMVWGGEMLCHRHIPLLPGMAASCHPLQHCCGLLLLAMVYCSVLCSSLTGKAGRGRTLL
jgi:hypothetical protein